MVNHNFFGAAAANLRGGFQELDVSMLSNLPDTQSPLTNILVWYDEQSIQHGVFYSKGDALTFQTNFKSMNNADRTLMLGAAGSDAMMNYEFSVTAAAPLAQLVRRPQMSREHQAVRAQSQQNAAANSDIPGAQAQFGAPRWARPAATNNSSEIPEEQTQRDTAGDVSSNNNNRGP